MKRLHLHDMVKIWIATIAFSPIDAFIFYLIKKKNSLEIANLQWPHHKSINNITLTNQILPIHMKEHAKWIGFVFLYLIHNTA